MLMLFPALLMANMPGGDSTLTKLGQAVPDFEPTSLDSGEFKNLLDMIAKKLADVDAP